MAVQADPELSELHPSKVCFRVAISCAEEPAVQHVKQCNDPGSAAECMLHTAGKFARHALLSSMFKVMRPPQRPGGGLSCHTLRSIVSVTLLAWRKFAFIHRHRSGT
jgi:hypothetical protein